MEQLTFPLLPDGRVYRQTGIPKSITDFGLTWGS